MRTRRAAVARSGRWGIAAGLALVALAPGPRAGAEVQGTVFLDRDGDGMRAPNEPGLSDVFVSNGRLLVRTDAEGRYALPDPTRGFVSVTRPAGFECRNWYRRDAGDFALEPAPDSDAFFFIQISDAHVFADAADFPRYSMPAAPWWLPRWLVAHLALWQLDDFYTEHSRSDIVESMRAAVQPYRDLRGAGSATVANAFLDEFARPGSELGRVSDFARQAFAEVASLEPRFVVSTGDLVLEGNTAPPAAVERWLHFYRDLAAATGIPFFHTLGNNELAAIQLEGYGPASPGYGRALYEEHFGPATYSFDRGVFHFAVSDTHVPIPRDPEPPWWNFDAMEPEVREWLDADLAAHPQRVRVVLNHEPFHSEPAWDPYEPADDAGLLAKHDVRYVLAGHVHRNGRARIGGTTHITTGALSGARWLLPATLHPRGYRMFWADGEHLVSAWKELGRPLLGFVDPPGDPALAPASRDPQVASALEAPATVVAVAAAAGGPFASVELHLDGEPVGFERLGRFFLRARVAPRAGRATAELELRAVDTAGATHRARLALRFTSGADAPNAAGVPGG